MPPLPPSVAADPAALLLALEQDMRRNLEAARARNSGECCGILEESTGNVSTTAERPCLTGIPPRISQLRASRVVDEADA